MLNQPHAARTGADIRRRHDETLFPIELGDARRVPSAAYQAWGLPEAAESEVVQCYADEWAAEQSAPEIVSQISKKAFGAADFAQLVRLDAAQRTAEVIKEKLAAQPTVELLEIGSGSGKSITEVLNLLTEAERAAVNFLLLDNNFARSPELDQLLTGALNVQLVLGSDLDLHQQEQFDVIHTVATIHHHAEIPFERYFAALKPAGEIIIADWHNSMWMHPANVLSLLQTIDWPEKKAGLEDFIRAYPTATEPFVDPNSSAALREANKQISKFWCAAIEIMQQNGLKSDQSLFYMLEGHRPVSLYLQSLHKAGFFDIETNQIIEGSELLMLTTAVK